MAFSRLRPPFPRDRNSGLLASPMLSLIAAQIERQTTYSEPAGRSTPAGSIRRALPSYSLAANTVYVARRRGGGGQYAIGCMPDTRRHWRRPAWGLSARSASCRSVGGEVICDRQVAGDLIARPFSYRRRDAVEGFRGLGGRDSRLAASRPDELIMRRKGTLLEWIRSSSPVPVPRGQCYFTAPPDGRSPPGY